MILLVKSFRKSNLLILEAVNTTYALTLILITQKHTDIDVPKISFQPLSCAVPNLLFYFWIFSAHTSSFLSIFGAYTNKWRTSTKNNRNATFKKSIQFKSTRITADTRTRRREFCSKIFHSKSPRGLAQITAGICAWFFRCETGHSHNQIRLNRLVLQKFFTYIPNECPPLINVRIEHIPHHIVGNHISRCLLTRLLLDLKASLRSCHSLVPKLCFLYKLRNGQQLHISKVEPKHFIPIIFFG